MSPRTVAALRRRGGSLYIWMDKAGLLRGRAIPPAEPITYNTFLHESCSIHIDAEFVPGKRWVVQWKLLPWPHFRVLYDPPPPSSSAARGFLEGIFDAPWV